MILIHFLIKVHATNVCFTICKVRWKIMRYEARKSNNFEINPKKHALSRKEQAKGLQKKDRKFERIKCLYMTFWPQALLDSAFLFGFIFGVDSYCKLSGSFV